VRHFPRALCFDRDYWLCRCDGFDVYRDGRWVGRVEELRFLSREDRPDWLMVRGRLFRRHPQAVTVDDVETIEPQAREVALRETFATDRTPV
jgi:hypothetical protein